MQYDYFIGMIKRHETQRIRAFKGANFTAVERVPNAFGLLIGEIISILNRNINNLCKSNEGIVLFGLQPASSMIRSDEPLMLNRLIDFCEIDEHFCCTLDYQVLPKDKLDIATAWEHTRSIIIDFTSGMVMDDERYVSQMLMNQKSGTVFGFINKRALAIVWSILKIKRLASFDAEAAQQFNYHVPVDIKSSYKREVYI